MRFGVDIWKSSNSSFAEIQTWVEASDPVAAALSVMARCGLSMASTVMVSDDVRVVGHFVDLEVSGPFSSVDCAMLYDYGLL